MLNYSRLAGFVYMCGLMEKKNNHHLRFIDVSFLHNILMIFADKYYGAKRTG